MYKVFIRYCLTEMNMWNMMHKQYWRYWLADGYYPTSVLYYIFWTLFTITKLYWQFSHIFFLKKFILINIYNLAIYNFFMTYECRKSISRKYNIIRITSTWGLYVSNKLYFSAYMICVSIILMIVVIKSMGTCQLQFLK